MEIKVLGPGCPKCESLDKVVRNAVAELDIIADIEKVTDILEIMGYGVMTTPALIIDGKILLKGRVPSVDELKKIIVNHK